MGRRNKAYSKSLYRQAYEKFEGMRAFGESKVEAKREGTDREKIFSYNTYQTYWKHTKYFIKWIEKNHPECTTLKSSKKHVNEWLTERTAEGLSAWTIQTEAKALGKLYGIKPEDEDYFNAPKRNRADIKRSRVDAERDRHFSKTNNAELINFCRGTGLRRSEIEKLRGGDLLSRRQVESIAKNSPYENQRQIAADALNFKNSEYYLQIKGKGGRERISPIVGEHAAAIVKRCKDTNSDDKVWQYVNQNADIHSYRGDYATAIYREYARVIDDIPYDKYHNGLGKYIQSDVYTCRKDEAGRKLDREAMRMCSKALGHNRVEVVANNYLRGL